MASAEKLQKCRYEFLAFTWRFELFKLTECFKGLRWYMMLLLWLKIYESYGPRHPTNKCNAKFAFKHSSFFDIQGMYSCITCVNFVWGLLVIMSFFVNFSTTQLHPYKWLQHITKTKCQSKLSDSNLTKINKYWMQRVW